MRSIERKLAMVGSLVLVAAVANFGTDQEARPVSAEMSSQKVSPTQVVIPPPVSTPDIVATQVSSIRATITALAVQDKKEKEIADLRATVTALQNAPTATPGREREGRDFIVVPVPVPPPTPSPDVITIPREDFNKFIDKGVGIALTAEANRPTQTPVIITREIVREKVVKEEGWWWRPLLIGGAIVAGGAIIAAALSRRARVFIVERLGGTLPPPPPVD